MSEILTDYVNLNQGIEEKDFFMPFLKWLENVIPEDCRDSFYRNVQTVKIELYSDKTTEIGNYNAKDNTLFIGRDYLQHLKEISKKNENPEIFFRREFFSTVMHELAHMSSSNYDPKTRHSTIRI